ncbi:FAD-dependent oxidoreductase [Candidatus Nanosalina sp. VS9-1]|uniref:FAD-dependent oxidoreductase n=1 Tax=Candidatus Nanosalina sp. VS9-1 TaxID=3388566 RepID=UPI0039DF3FF3
MKTVTVIGGGVSGLQAGVFTAKAGEDTLVLDTGESLVKNTSNIKNLIGQDSIAGNELLKKGKDKLERFNGELKEEKVEKVERTDEGLKVTTSEDEYMTEYVVVASAGNLDFLELDVEFEDGAEGPYMMDKHLKTDDSNKACENVYAAGLANSWEYQTSIAIGDGAKAAVNLLSDLRDEPYTDHDT